MGASQQTSAESTSLGFDDERVSGHVRRYTELRSWNPATSLLCRAELATMQIPVAVFSHRVTETTFQRVSTSIGSLEIPKGSHTIADRTCDGQFATAFV